MKEKRKLRDKMELKMIHPGDKIDQNDDIDLFNIKKIKSKHVSSITTCLLNYFNMFQSFCLIFLPYVLH